VGKANALIAVVDDELPVRTMLRRALRLADYDVATFANGAEFPDLLRSRQPDGVVLDVRMPGLSGFDVIRRMRETDIHASVVLITASDDGAIDRAAAALDATSVLRKPFSVDALLAAVDPVAPPLPAARGGNPLH
jgi:DNA-binding response OmpR family regulator